MIKKAYLQQLVDKVDNFFDVIKRRVISRPQEGHNQEGLGVVGWVIEYIKDGHRMIPWVIFERSRAQHLSDATLLVIPSHLLDDYTFSIVRVSVNEACLWIVNQVAADKKNCAHSQRFTILRVERGLSCSDPRRSPPTPQPRPKLVAVRIEKLLTRGP